MRTLFRPLGILVALFLPAACSSDAPLSGADSGGGDSPADCTPLDGITVDCLVYYSSGDAGSDEEPPPSLESHVILGPLAPGEQDEASAEVGEFAFTAFLDNDRYDGPSMSVGVSAIVDGAELGLLGHLYQFPTEGVCNQFVGNHGFTGLVYLTHPVTTAGFQFTCRAE